ncbi:MAG: hypothetical protein O7G85_06255 [Planctomycetota bacterium]|nr:hypothetical protein [Planctomycetota bacterium]
MRLYFVFPVCVATLVVCILFGGCAASHQPAASSNLQLTPKEKATKRVLSPADRQEVSRIFSSLAGDHQPVNPPRAARYGVRWRDVPIALGYACKALEMAITRTTETDDRFVFELTTIDDKPCRFEISRVDDETVYEIQRVVVGRFSSPADQEKALQLRTEFDRQLLLFGKKRALTTSID